MPDRTAIAVSSFDSQHSASVGGRPHHGPRPAPRSQQSTQLRSARPVQSGLSVCVSTSRVPTAGLISLTPASSREKPPSLPPKGKTFCGRYRLIASLQRNAPPAVRSGPVRDGARPAPATTEPAIRPSPDPRRPSQVGGRLRKRRVRFCLDGRTWRIWRRGADMCYPPSAYIRMQGAHHHACTLDTHRQTCTIRRAYVVDVVYRAATRIHRLIDVSRGGWAAAESGGKERGRGGRGGVMQCDAVRCRMFRVHA